MCRVPYFSPHDMENFCSRCVKPPDQLEVITGLINDYQSKNQQFSVNVVDGGIL